MSTNMTHFVWPSQFACTVITENTILPSFYNITISVEPIEDQSNIGIGFRKIRHLVDNYLHNSVIICKDNPKSESIKDIENNRVVLPTEPYDFFVGSILFTKFLKITEKHFDIGYITIDSTIGDNVQYTIVDPAECGLDLSGDHWWNSDSIDTGTGNLITWKELNIQEGPRFEPVVIQGGLTGKS